MANPPDRPKHFSMIRSFHLADFFTLGNAACGILSIFLAMNYMASGSVGSFLTAAAMAPLALLFDVFDGRIARWRNQHSPLGRELDSLADVISFGVSPAVLGYAAGLRAPLDWAVLIYFVCCGVSRLARYNVTAESLSGDSGKVAYFEGTPIPTSVLLTAVLALAAWQGRVGEQLWGGAWMAGGMALHPLVLLFGLSGTLMISKTLRIPKL
ncbi:CDP-diacylglycerol--serine O-phosphatidyltransferase [Noviherbaspirillum galbum]|uniref:CDP-diacylglycerol--serine O-phosphatidyltransferase n=1 Tax=Noviherbaspirillum galbum TaxID=2709383 RepID=A0A6B3SU30_9BURK|nr:CDP-diacylglycerol--serine O-phosphatidyltransferase [Noviherbaspirillum galbum]NEX64101.1 CDP-diacylglycerol--serine O-phosphatidyltransferase [Noviherbaspirillum galbum]